MMPSINFSDEDFEFLRAQAEAAGITIEEYVGFMVDRQRLIVKYQDSQPANPTDVKAPNLEAPHRKWGM